MDSAPCGAPSPRSCRINHRRPGVSDPLRMALHALKQWSRSTVTVCLRWHAVRLG